MEDRTTRTIIGKAWTKTLMECKIVPKTSGENTIPERHFFKCHKCGRTKINEFQVIEEVQCAEEKEESDQDSEISDDTPAEDYPIEKITAFFESTKVHTHFPQWGENLCNLINVQGAKIRKTKASRGKGYTSEKSCITSILINDIDVQVNLGKGAFFTCVGKHTFNSYFPNRKTIYYQ
ncbi:hypothetical protein O181_005123 [Austropuccinia psidii MF-1]|uniref:Uncharacterized protein n=1 Tax=Austropuccinia psidii MF-1 TaxID=1389203 RepID=A0A9Q3BHP0_9BASI|nr:hypothetical protein [Austropuccinia psidii MF-1]